MTVSGHLHHILRKREQKRRNNFSAYPDFFQILVKIRRFYSQVIINSLFKTTVMTILKKKWIISVIVNDVMESLKKPLKKILKIGYRVC